MNPQMQEILNEQVKNEFYAFYSYLAMSAWLEANDWPNMAQWMRTHSEEEQMHAMKIYDYINDRNGIVTLHGLEQPAAEFDTVEELFEAALEHEQHVTASINRIYEMAKQENDYPTQVLMEWFIQEQVEEEKIVEDALTMVRRAGNDPFQLLYVDGQISQIQGGEADPAAA